MLNALTCRDVRIAVLSNKPHGFTQMCVDEFLSEWSFDIVQGVTETVLPKPDPAGALMVAHRLGVAPEKVIYLGDTNTDMKTAVAAGMFPVGALWGFRDAEELSASGAEALIDRPEKLIDLLEEGG
jgi:phosphoglycolate phosphatase